jgi:predicted thioredoxin/glutaredoxin
MKIDIFTSESCGSYYQLRENIEQAIAELRVEAEVSYRTVYYDDAVSLGIKGSPSVWINGKDAFPGGSSPGIT